MKEFPIIFSASMVRAILEGRKTQTRRAIKPQPSEDWNPDGVEWYAPAKVDKHGEMYPGKEVYGAADENEGRVCPYGVPGQKLWVRETFSIQPQSEISSRDVVLYRADIGNTFLDGKWRPSIYMPRWASRITLAITEVRVERVQEISEEDCRAEGIDTSVVNPSPRGVAPIYPKQYGSAKDCFRDLWDSINAKRGFPWDSNPWVWAISFKRV